MTTYEEAFGGLQNESILLDSSATTYINDEVFAKMEPYLRVRSLQGNASSSHSWGEVARRAIEEAREIIASAINADPSEIYFTSGGTESNNWVIKGLRNRYKFRPTHIISSSIEHSSILESLKYRWTECEDIEYTLINPNYWGIIEVEDVVEAFKLNTNLVSVQMVNNEIGTIQPVSEIGAKCIDNGILLHCDAVQAFGQMPIDVKKQNIALLSAASHKINGPKGIGMLYISNDVKGLFHPFLHGGHQERGFRASTENVAGIVGFGKATEIALKNMDAVTFHETSLRDLLLDKVMKIPGIHLNGNIEYMDPRHVNLKIDGVRAEELIAMLDSVNIYVSSGSACNSSSNEPSHVLKAIGLTDEEANSSIRVSISGYNSIDDINVFVDYINEFVNVLRERK